MAKDQVVKDNSASSRSFDYSLKGCVLRFTLRVDNTDELIPFETLLKRALADVGEEISNLSAKRKKR